MQREPPNGWAGVAIRQTRLDTYDAEQLAACVESAGWTLIRNRLVKQRQQYVEKLLTAPLEEVPRLQGAIDAVTRSLEVPDILAQEMRKRNDAP